MNTASTARRGKNGARRVKPSRAAAQKKRAVKPAPAVQRGLPPRRPVRKKMPYLKPELERKEKVGPCAPDAELFPEFAPSRTALDRTIPPGSGTGRPKG